MDDIKRLAETLERMANSLEKIEGNLGKYMGILDACGFDDEETRKKFGSIIKLSCDELVEELESRKRSEAEEAYEESFEKYYECSLPDDDDDNAKESDL